MTVTIVTVCEDALSCTLFGRIPYMDMNFVMEVAGFFFSEIVEQWPGDPGTVYERDNSKADVIFANRKIFI
jgi:hypothetical protein